jgi:hypothetical protein
MNKCNIDGCLDVGDKASLFQIGKYKILIQVCQYHKTEFQTKMCSLENCDNIAYAKMNRKLDNNINLDFLFCKSHLHAIKSSQSDELTITML